MNKESEQKKCFIFDDVYIEALKKTTRKQNQH